MKKILLYSIPILLISGVFAFNVIAETSDTTVRPPINNMRAIPPKVIESYGRVNYGYGYGINKLEVMKCAIGTKAILSDGKTRCISEVMIVTQTELDNGWYYGDENYKKIGTPNDWKIMYKGTKSSQWVSPKKIQGLGITTQSSELEKKVLEWRKNAEKQILEIDKEIQKLQERKAKINKELEDKIQKERIKTGSSYGYGTDGGMEISNILYIVSNGYSQSSSYFEIDSNGKTTLTYSNIRLNKKTIKTSTLTKEEFTNLKNLIYEADVLNLKDNYKCSDNDPLNICPFDTNGYSFKFTIGKTIKTINTDDGDIPKSFSAVHNELQRLMIKFGKENIIDKTVKGMRTFFQK